MNENFSPGERTMYSPDSSSYHLYYYTFKKKYGHLNSITENTMEVALLITPELQPELTSILYV
jgi:hypothetical protein